MRRLWARLLMLGDPLFWWACCFAVLALGAASIVAMGLRGREPAPPCGGRATIYYNRDTEPVRIERDCDSDGKIDVVEEP